MCEIYGYSGNRETELNTDLREFYSHACEHPNGWGLALLGKNKTEIKREVIRADRSDYLKERLTKPISSVTALAHIRLATIGNEEYDNCHPFTGVDKSARSWTLIHNGTVFESDRLNRYVFRQKGETDSERILLYIIDRIDQETESKGRPLEAEERFAVLDEIVRTSSPKNKLNLLIYDGELMYVHTNFKDSLFERTDGAGITFSTRPLSTGKWKNTAFTTLVAYRNGQRVLTGTNHRKEYIFDKNSYKPLYLAYSGL